MPETTEAWDAKYKRCKVCGKSLDEGLTALALRRFEEVTCSSACMQADVKKTYGCCDKAEFLPCVCMYSFTCPVHGEKHIGTHD